MTLIHHSQWLFPWYLHIVEECEGPDRIPTGLNLQPTDPESCTLSLDYSIPSVHIIITMRYDMV